jgi:adenylate cyclase
MADVVGYSRLMGQNEAATLDAIKSLRKDVLHPLISKHRGRIVQLVGDGVLVEFASAVNAVQCAVELQRQMESANESLPQDRRIALRIGVNLGDVVVEGSDLYGDGINVAARLEALADPGSVVISHTVHSQVRGKVEFGFDDLGEQTLKNIAEPIRVFRVLTTSIPPGGATAQPSKPSIAVLPFTNMSGDPEQEYFSDGITEDIITDLSKVSALKVISRNTVFTFKGKAVDVGEVAKRLNVGHVVEGSIRKSGGRVRITAQLIDASSDSHIWVERYDRDFGEIFALQDEIAQAIVAALKVKLLPEEERAIETRSTHNAESYHLYLLGRHYLGLHDTRSISIALRFVQQALKLDPLHARAWALAGLCQSFLNRRGKSEDSGLVAAEKAISLDPTLAEAHAVRGRVLALAGRVAEALQAHAESLRLESDSHDVQHYSALTYMHLGRHEAAVEHFERAAQLQEVDHYSLSLAAQCYESLGHIDRAKDATRRALERVEREVTLRPDNANAVEHGATLLAFLGESERAREWASRAIVMEPDDPVGHYNIACTFARLGESPQALDLLETCVPKLSAEFITWIKLDIDLISLREHPRFKALIARGESRLAAVRCAQK